jgi:RNA polymerase sigma-70 factor (ECF subfamily)
VQGWFPDFFYAKDLMKGNKEKEFALIAKIKEGDASHFRLLVEDYKDVSFSLACSILKNEQDAEDALQESFIKAFKGLKSFDFKASFSTWFYRIVVNTCLTKYKHQNRHGQLVDIDTYSNIECSSNDAPFKMVNNNETRHIVNHILDLIKEEESLLLRLFYLAERSVAEINQITGFKDSKIKVTLHRARKSFQQKLEQIYGTEITMSL